MLCLLVRLLSAQVLVKLDSHMAWANLIAVMTRRMIPLVLFLTTLARLLSFQLINIFSKSGCLDFWVYFDFLVCLHVMYNYLFAKISAIALPHICYPIFNTSNLILIN